MTAPRGDDRAARLDDRAARDTRGRTDPAALASEADRGASRAGGRTRTGVRGGRPADCYQPPPPSSFFGSWA
jgi:hypothetical protein